MSKLGTVLVTGGAGYIGSHVCKRLNQLNYLPVSYDNLVYGHREAVRWGPLEIGDIADRDTVDRVLKTYQPIAIMHFAAYACVGESVMNPGKYYTNNVAGSLALLERARVHDIHRFIFSSTCATYGIPQVTPISEEHSTNPVNPYGQTKLMVERILGDFDLAHGIKSVSLRYFNAAGADPELDTGEHHEPETHLIPLVLDAAMGRRSDVKVFGNDYDTPDGTCVRDYIHVNDLADAHILALQALLEGTDSRTYNLGNGQGFSVKEVIDCAQRVTGYSIKNTLNPRRAGDPARLIGDATRIRSELGWEPKFQKLEDIVDTAWRWHQKLYG